jgi:hypothetical protein
MKKTTTNLTLEDHRKLGHELKVMTRRVQKLFVHDTKGMKFNHRLRKSANRAYIALVDLRSELDSQVFVDFSDVGGDGLCVYFGWHEKESTEDYEQQTA